MIINEAGRNRKSEIKMAISQLLLLFQLNVLFVLHADRHVAPENYRNENIIHMETYIHRSNTAAEIRPGTNFC